MNASVGYVPIFLTNFRNVRLHTSPLALHYIIRVLFQALKQEKYIIRLQEYDVMMLGHRGIITSTKEEKGGGEGEGAVVSYLPPFNPIK